MGVSASKIMHQTSIEAFTKNKTHGLAHSRWWLQLNPGETSSLCLSDNYIRLNQVTLIFDNFWPNKWRFHMFQMNTSWRTWIIHFASFQRGALFLGRLCHPPWKKLSYLMPSLDYFQLWLLSPCILLYANISRKYVNFTQNIK